MINATPRQNPGTTRSAAPECGARTKAFCSGSDAPVIQQVILSALANNAPTAHDNNDLDEGKLFKARRKSEEVGVCYAFAGQLKRRGLYTVEHGCSTWILVRKQTLRRLRFPVRPRVLPSANQAVTDLQRCGQLSEETRHAVVAPSLRR